MELSKYEQETILLTNEEDAFWDIDTYNARLKRKLDKFAAAHPELCKQERVNRFGGVRYRVDKKRLSICLTPPRTEEQRRAARAKAKQQGLGTTIYGNRF